MTLHQHIELYRVHLAIKATIAAAICANIGIVLHLDYGFLSPLISVIALVLFRGQTIKAGVPGFLAILASGSIAIIISIALHEVPLAYVMCMLAWLFIWMAFLTPLPLGHLLGGILTAMILFTVVLGTGRPEDLLLGFWTQVFVALVIAVCIDHLLWPTGAQDSLYKTLAALFEDYAVHFESLATAPNAGHVVDRTSMAELRYIAHLANFFARNLSTHTRAEFELNLRCRLIWDRLAGLRRFIRSREFATLHNKFTDEVKSVSAELANLYRNLADDAFHQRRTTLLGNNVRRRIEAKIATIDTMQYRQSTVTDETLGSATFNRFLRLALADYVTLTAAYNAMLDGRVDAAPGWWQRGSPVPDLRSWPSADRFKQSAKLVLVVLILLIGVLYLNFPGSGLVAFYGIAFGLTANLGQLYMKGKSGTFGVMGGLVYGVIGVMIVVQTPHFPVLMGIFALGMFVAIYLSSGGESVAAMGLQAALVIPFVLLVFEGPEWTLENGVTRAAALVTSAAVALVVQRLVWPVDPLVMFRTEVAKALDEIGVAWQQLWANAKCGTPDSNAAARVPTESLVLAFGQGAELLKDSRYVIGSGHHVAHAYMNILSSLEQIFSELQLLARLMQQSNLNPLRDGAITSLTEHIETVAQGLSTVSDCFCHQAAVDQLLELQARLAALRDSATCWNVTENSQIAVSLEDQRQISLLFETTRETTKSLQSVVEYTLIVIDHSAQTSAGHQLLKWVQHSHGGSHNRKSNRPRRLNADRA